MTIPLLIVGIVLRANSQWFHAAHTVGDLCFWFGIAGLAIQALIVVGAAVIAWLAR